MSGTSDKPRLEHLAIPPTWGAALWSVLDAGARFRMEEINEAGAALIGVEPSALLGRDLRDAIPGAASVGLDRLMQSVWRTGAARRLPAALYPTGRGDGWLEGWILPQPDDLLLVLFADVSQHVELQSELSESRDRFRLGFETSAVAMDLVAPDGRLLATNPAMSAMLGYTREELVSLEFRKLTHPDDVAASEERFAGLLAGDYDSYSLRKRYLHKDGHIVWGDLHVSASRDESGAVQQLLAQVVDVTDQELVRHREHRLRRRLEGLWAIAVDIDATHKELCDRVLERILEVTGSEFSFFGFLDADEQVMTLHSWSRRAFAECEMSEQPRLYPIASGGLWADAVRKRRPVLVDEYSPELPGALGLPEGHVSITRLLSVPIFVGERIAAVAAVANRDTPYTAEDARDLQALVGSVLAVLLRREAQEALAWEHNVNATLTQLSSTLLSTHLTLQQVAEEVERCARQLTGSEHGLVSEIDPETRENVVHTFSAMMGDSCSLRGSDQRIAFPPLPDGTYPQLCGLALTTGEPFYTNDPTGHPACAGLPEGHVPLRRLLCVPAKLAGEVVGEIAQANADAPYRDEHLRAVERLAELYALAIDRDRACKERDRLQDQLRQAQKLEAIGTLAGGIAHDFNNILSALIGYNELARDRAGDDPLLQEYLEEVGQAGHRAGALVEQILSFARRSEVKPQPLQLHLPVREALRLLRQTVPSNIPIVQRITRSDDWVLADPTQIHQIVMNLCTNAYHAVRSQGGTIRVELQSVDLPAQGRREALDLEPGPYVRLSVADDGPGIDPVTLGRIFDPFFTTKGKGEGTGLGLSVVHGIVKAHGGGIDVRSVLGEGSTFIVHLPRRPAPALRAASRTGDLPGGSERILVVDDEPALATLAKEQLSRLGYDVVAVTSSNDALALVFADPQRFDLVFSDQSMPGLTGAALAHRILQVRPELPIIVYTGYSHTLDASSAAALGIRRLLSKPVSPEQLARAIREVLDGAR